MRRRKERVGGAVVGLLGRRGTGKDEKIIPFIGDDLMNILDVESAGRDGDEHGGRLAGAPPWKAALSRERGRRERGREKQERGRAEEVETIRMEKGRANMPW